MLLDELKQIGSSMVAEIEKLLDATFAQPALHQIRNLQGWIRRVEKVIRRVEKVKASACEFQGQFSRASRELSRRRFRSRKIKAQVGGLNT